jgi:hypothetical protein
VSNELQRPTKRVADHVDLGGQAASEARSSVLPPFSGCGLLVDPHQSGVGDQILILVILDQRGEYVLLQCRRCRECFLDIMQAETKRMAWPIDDLLSLLRV